MKNPPLRERVRLVRQKLYQAMPLKIRVQRVRHALNANRVETTK